MNYTMTQPCDQCPFLDTPRNRRAFTLRRLQEFAGQGIFPCHKTAETVEDEDGSSSYEATDKSVVCAGMLIFNEKRDQPNQMMRIAERLGSYDMRKLNMNANVR